MPDIVLFLHRWNIFPSFGTISNKAGKHLSSGSRVSIFWRRKSDPKSCFSSCCRDCRTHCLLCPALSPHAHPDFRPEETHTWALSETTLEKWGMYSHTLSSVTFSVNHTVTFTLLAGLILLRKNFSMLMVYIIVFRIQYNIWKQQLNEFHKCKCLTQTISQSSESYDFVFSIVSS